MNIVDRNIFLHIFQNDLFLKKFWDVLSNNVAIITISNNFSFKLMKVIWQNSLALRIFPNKLLPAPGSVKSADKEGPLFPREYELR